jgi:hypothetical protein
MKVELKNFSVGDEGLELAVRMSLAAIMLET